MAEQNLSTPTTEDELTKALNKAVTDGNMEEVDRLMAVELPEPEVKEEPEVPEEPVIPEQKETEEVNPEDKSSEVVEEDGTKDEAATKTDAASKPAEPAEEVPDIKALQAEIHRLKSDAGRVPYMQRKMQELERELREAKLSRTTAPAGGDASPDNATIELPKSLQKRIAALKEIDPDLAETLEEGFLALRQEQLATSSHLVKEVTEAEAARADEEFLQQQYQALVAEVPIAPQIFGSPEWREWKERLSPARRAFAESQYADEVKIAISAFMNDMQARAQHTNGNVQVPGSSTTVTTSEGGDPSVAQGTTETASKVQETRNRKMAAAPSVPGSVAAKSGSVELDAQKQFEEFYRQIQKENHLG